MNLEYGFVDGSYIKAHQQSAGTAGGKTQIIGKSLAGNTTRIHLIVRVYPI
jgi:hypothetical protein